LYCYLFPKLADRTSIEANTIIIAACVPTITPLLESLFGKRILSSRTRHTSGYMQGSLIGRSHVVTNLSMASRIHQGHTSSNKWTSSATTQNVAGDVESQKSILGADDDIRLDRITRTDAVIIEYEPAEEDRTGRGPFRSWRNSRASRKSMS
jgi:hypothetical protein